MTTCQCCGYKTIEEKNNYEICPICFWEDDIYQNENQFSNGGANKISLVNAQMNFIKFACCDKQFEKNVRKIYESDEYDNKWKPFVIKALEEFMGNEDIAEKLINEEIETINEEDEKIIQINLYYEAMFLYDKGLLKKILFKTIKNGNMSLKKLSFEILKNYKYDIEVQNLLVDYYLDKTIEKEIKTIVNEFLEEKTKYEMIAYSEIKDIINKEISEMEINNIKKWESVKIVPKLWKVKGHEFFMWVVGKEKEIIIYYNDIEEGFNISKYKEDEIIEEYWCNQDSLKYVMTNLK